MISVVISRNLAFSAQSGRLKEFRPCAVLLLRGVIRGMLFEKGRRDDIRTLMRRFPDLLPAGYRAFMQLLTAFPCTTRNACLLISAIVRFLHIRRKLDAMSREIE